MQEYTCAPYRKLYVNKCQRGSSPEIEQLRQSQLGEQLLQSNLSSMT